MVAVLELVQSALKRASTATIADIAVFAHVRFVQAKCDMQHHSMRTHVLDYWYQDYYYDGMSITIVSQTYSAILPDRVSIISKMSASLPPLP